MEVKNVDDRSFATILFSGPVRFLYLIREGQRIFSSLGRRRPPEAIYATYRIQRNQKLFVESDKFVFWHAKTDDIERARVRPEYVDVYPLPYNSESPVTYRRFCVYTFQRRRGPTRPFISIRQEHKTKDCPLEIPWITTPRSELISVIKTIYQPAILALFGKRRT